MAFTQKPSTSCGVRTTTSASGASSRIQPSGTEKRKLGTGRISALGWTATRAVSSDGFVSMAAGTLVGEPSTCSGVSGTSPGCRTGNPPGVLVALHSYDQRSTDGGDERCGDGSRTQRTP